MSTTTTDFDRRVAAALADAAASTTTSDDALAAILRRAESPRPGVSGRHVVLICAATGLVTAGLAGIVLVAPGSGEAPGSGSDVVTSVAITPTTLPEAGYVDDALFYDDATLLSILYANFGVGQVADQARVMGDTGDPPGMVQCMQDRGFTYTPQPGYRDTLGTDPRYTLAPAEFAASYGFGVAAEALGLIPAEYPADANADIRGQQDSAFSQAESDCFGEAIDRGDLHVAEQSWVSAHDYVWEQFKPIITSDERVVEALATWQQCMLAAGFEYDDPATIKQAFQSRLYDLVGFNPVEPGTPEHDDVEQLMAEEIAVATANASCVEPYTATLREVILDHYDEYKSMFQAALDAGIDSDGVG